MKKLMALAAVLTLVGCTSSEPEMEMDNMAMLERRVTSIEETVNGIKQEAMELQTTAESLNQRMDALDSSMVDMKDSMSK